jgi:NTE family protein
MSRVAVVLPGGGARGAYEIGALSVVLPALEARGERVDLWCGTSVGAINAALYASVAHLEAGEAVARAEEGWRALAKSDVIERVVGTRLPLTALRVAGDWFGVPGVGATGLLDPRPLERSLERWIDWLSLARNVRAGSLDAVCAVATSLQRGGPVAFVHTLGAMPAAKDEIRYVRACLTSEHVRASAAIPTLFPPVEVRTPRSAAGFYMDGATRLNSPIKPAIALGADRVIVIGFEPMDGRSPAAAPPHRPHLADVAANLLDGLLVDPVADDVRRLAAINAFFVDGVAGPQHAARTYRRARGRPPYRTISYALIAPRRRGELGRIAGVVFRRRYGGVRALRSPDFLVMSRLLGTRSPSQGELLSFLFFDPAYIAALIEAGRQDAERWIERHPRFWCSDAAHDLALAPPGDDLREEDAVREWRELARRR